MYDYPGNTVGGSPYTPGDVLTIQFLDENVTYSLSSSSVVYYSVTVLFGNTGMDNLYVGVIAYDSSTDTFDYNYPTNLGYSYTFNNVSYLGLRVISYTQVLDSTGNPLTLGPNDFVIGYSVANASINPITPTSTNTTIGIGNSPLLQFCINTEPPIWNTSTKSWIPAFGFIYNITPQFCTGYSNGSDNYFTNSEVEGYYNSVNSGFGLLSSNNGDFVFNGEIGRSSYVQLYWCNNTITTTDLSKNAAVINIKLLILVC